MSNLTTLAFVKIFLLCAVCALAAPQGSKQNFKTGTYTPQPSQPASPNDPAVHVLPLSRQSKGTATSAGYVQSLRKGNEVNGVYGNSKVTSVESGMSMPAPSIIKAVY